MRILAIDPGNTKSAWVHYDRGQIYTFGKHSNASVLKTLSKSAAEHLAVEMISSYGMSVGRTVFETAFWAGRFVQAWGDKPFTLIYRKDVKIHLCGTMRANDATIRAALLERFNLPPDVKNPGGISADVWAALAVAVTFEETENKTT